MARRSLLLLGQISRQTVAFYTVYDDEDKAVTGVLWDLQGDFGGAPAGRFELSAAVTVDICAEDDVAVAFAASAVAEVPALQNEFAADRTGRSRGKKGRLHVRFDARLGRARRKQDEYCERAHLHVNRSGHKNLLP